MANNSITQRIRITGTGKLIRRPMGINHFKAKKAARRLSRKKDHVLATVDLKGIKKYF